MELDLKGMSCPLPAIKVKSALAKESLDALTVIIDCSTPTENIEFIADSAGYDCAIEKQEEVTRITISKRSQS